MAIVDLDQAIRAVCPNIDGVRVVDPNNRSSWSVDFQPTATAAQKAAADSVLASFDMAVLKADPVAPTGRAIYSFTANVTIGSVAGAAFTDKTFVVPGLLTTDQLLGVVFPAGLPITMSYVPQRISAVDTVIVRFMKIATGAVTPPAQQMTVIVGR